MSTLNMQLGFLLLCLCVSFLDAITTDPRTIRLRHKDDDSSTSQDDDYCSEAYEIVPFRNDHKIIRVPYKCQNRSENDRCVFNEVQISTKNGQLLNRSQVNPKQNELVLRVEVAELLMLKLYNNAEVRDLCRLTSEPEEVASSRYGELCDVDEECQVYDPNAECQNRCTCKDSHCYVPAYSICAPCYALGENCTYPESLENGYCKSRDSICRRINEFTDQGVCDCRSGFVQIGHNCWISMNTIEHNYEMAAKVAIAAAVVVALAILLAIVWNSIKNRIPDARSRAPLHSRVSVDSIDHLVEERLRNRPPVYSPDSDKPPSYEESVSDETASSSSQSFVTNPAVVTSIAIATPNSPPPEYSSTPPMFPVSYNRTVSYENQAYVSDDSAPLDENNFLPSISSSVDNTPLNTPQTLQPQFNTYL